MQQGQDEFSKLLGDDVLAQVSHHVLLRGKRECDIQVYHILNGPNAGAFWAVPKISWRPSHKDFFGRGETDHQALQDCLRKSRGIPLDTMFPRPGPEKVDGDSNDVLSALL
jgi:hypothetical protein